MFFLIIVLIIRFSTYVTNRRSLCLLVSKVLDTGVDGTGWQRTLDEMKVFNNKFKQKSETILRIVFSGSVYCLLKWLSQK